MPLKSAFSLQLKKQDTRYMQRTLALAAMGRGVVSPNPMVGCVLVWQDKIIGEGYHRQYGEAHAEVNAIASVRDKSLLSKSTVYVNLEPCVHQGKTPPCTQLLVDLKVKKVVIANIDTNPLVNRKGLDMLQKAGIKVLTDVMAQAGRKLNRRFFNFMERKMPYVILKWAETADGFVAKTTFDSKWISNRLSRCFVHQWRTQEDAIMVGTNTASYDNPQLTARDWPGKNPLRIVIDKNLTLSQNLYLFNNMQDTICYNLLQAKISGRVLWVRLNEKNFLRGLLKDLYRRKVQSLMVEGGANLLQSFIDEGLWNEIRVFKSQITFEQGVAAPLFRGRLSETDYVGTDILQTYFSE